MGKRSTESVELGVSNAGFHKDPHDENPPPPYDNFDDKKVESGEDGANAEVGRDTWGNPLEFLMSCISMSVGLGNVWRFPFTAYANGGGAFLIPYLIVLIFIGKPLYFMEMVLGQFSSCGSVKVWAVVPISKGVGYGQAIATWCVVTYYCYLMALTVFYFFASFQAVLPWTVCDPEWASPTCYPSGNTTGVNTTGRLSSSEEYFLRNVIRKLDNIEDGIGVPEWRLTLCLLFCWFCILVILMKGVASSGKVSYFTAIFPYVILIALLIRGVTLEGAGDGMLFFVTPQWDRLVTADVWYAAVTQCFFSLSVSFGPIVTYSSYNPFRHKIYRDSIIISFMDTLASVLSGVTIFAILGHLAFVTGRDITDFVQGGTGLAFVSYPEVIAKFDAVPQLFAVLFFLMLFTLGVGSAVSLTNCIITIICDEFPQIKRWIVTSVVCAAGFLIGIVYVTPGGQFVFDVVDYFGGGFIIYIMAIVQTVSICWIYGLKEFMKDVKYMLDISLGFYWKFSWGFFIPVALLVIFTYAMVTYQPLQSGGLVLPDAALAAGWALAGIALAQIPGWATYAIYKEKRGTSLWQRIKWSFISTAEWSPKDLKNHEGWVQFKNEPYKFTWYPTIPKFLRRCGK